MTDHRIAAMWQQMQMVAALVAPPGRQAEALNIVREAVMPKNQSRAQKLARAMQRETGKPYTVCLAEVKAGLNAEPPGNPCSCADPNCPTPEGQYTHGPQ